MDKEKPNTFLWVLRGLTTAFFLGYLMSIFMAYFVGEYFPSGNLWEDLAGTAFLLFFILGYWLMWIRKEVLGGLVFIIWYAALWPAELFIGGNTFTDAHFPGTLMLILGILFLVYRIKKPA